MRKIQFKKRILIITLIQIITAAFITSTYALDLKPEIDQHVKPFMNEGVAAGMIIGVVKDGETQIIAYGEKTKGTNVPPDADTLFEIGSVTKVFTGILLADMVQKGIVKLDDPVQKYLPEGVTMPILNGKAITLEHLATHTSGLPAMPDNFAPADPLNPFIDYREAQMYEFLNIHKLRRPPGQREYSNIGMGLLGYLMAKKMGKSYEQLLVESICGPLGMKDTTITLNEDQLARFATPYNSALNAVKPWDIAALVSAGAIRSTCNDMIKFIKANIKDDDKSLTRALHLSHEEHYKNRMAIGLAWHILPDGTRWHNGGTGGFHSWLGISTEEKAGVIVLANTANLRISRLARNIMRIVLGENVEPEKPRKEIELSTDVLESYKGVYSLTPSFKITVTVENGSLIIQATGQGKIRFYPESKTRFFCNVVDAQISFVPGKEGKIDHLILHQGGLNQKAVRE